MKIEKDNFSVCDRGDSEEKLRVTSPEDALQLSYRILVGIKASKLIGFFTVNSQNISKKLPKCLQSIKLYTVKMEILA